MTKHEDIKKLVAQRNNGRTEVINEFGRADVVTSNELIEVTCCDNYRESLGRLLSYHADIKLRQLTPRLHLYAGADQFVTRFEDIINEAVKICESHGVRVSFSMGEGIYYASEA